MNLFNQDNVIKYAIVSFMFAFIVFGLYGGCGGSSGGSDTDPTPTPTNTSSPSPTPTATPTSTPTPTASPQECIAPPLTDDYGDLIYMFVDELAEVVMGVFSDGIQCYIGIADISLSIDTTEVYIGDIISDNLCELNSATIIDPELEFDIFIIADGSGTRLNDGSTFNTQIISEVTVEFEGECEEIAELDPEEPSITRAIGMEVLDLAQELIE